MRVARRVDKAKSFPEGRIQIQEPGKLEFTTGPSVLVTVGAQGLDCYAQSLRSLMRINAKYCTISLTHQDILISSEEQNTFISTALSSHTSCPEYLIQPLMQSQVGQPHGTKEFLSSRNEQQIKQQKPQIYYCISKLPNYL